MNLFDDHLPPRFARETLRVRAYFRHPDETTIALSGPHGKQAGPIWSAAIHRRYCLAAERLFPWRGLAGSLA
jgi:hypothetical protein